MLLLFISPLFKNVSCSGLVWSQKKPSQLPGNLPWASNIQSRIHREAFLLQKPEWGSLQEWMSRMTPMLCSAGHHSLRTTWPREIYMLCVYETHGSLKYKPWASRVGLFPSPICKSLVCNSGIICPVELTGRGGGSGRERLLALKTSPVNVFLLSNHLVLIKLPESTRRKPKITRVQTNI